MEFIRDREQDVCEAVSSWLSYKSLTGLRSLINESSIKVPISEFLSTNSKLTIQAEVPHPKFRTGGRGRPKQIDYVIKGKGNRWDEVYETKYHPDTPQRVIDDLCRLICLSHNGALGNPRRYFLFAGRLQDGSADLSQKVQIGGGKVELFSNMLLMSSQDVGTKVVVEPETLEAKRRNMFASFCEEYDIELPTKFESVLCGRANAGRYIVYLWRLSQRRGVNARKVTAI